MKRKIALVLSLLLGILVFNCSLVLANNTEEVCVISSENLSPILYDKDGLNVTFNKCEYTLNESDILITLDVDNNTDSVITFGFKDVEVDNLELPIYDANIEEYDDGRCALNFSISLDDLKAGGVSNFSDVVATLYGKKNGEEIFFQKIKIDGSIFGLNKEKGILLDDFVQRYNYASLICRLAVKDDSLKINDIQKEDVEKSIQDDRAMWVDDNARIAFFKSEENPSVITGVMFYADSDLPEENRKLFIYESISGLYAIDLTFKEEDLGKVADLFGTLIENKELKHDKISLTAYSIGEFDIFDFSYMNETTTKEIGASEKYDSDSEATLGEKNALEKAYQYFNSSAFSYKGIIEQLEYEGFTTSEATYAADNCGENWNRQALKCAERYFNTSAFSYKGIIEQLEYEGFTTSEATYAANNCNEDWNEQAAKCAERYLKASAFSYDGMIEQLEYEGFTHEEAIYGARNGLIY